MTPLAIKFAVWFVRYGWCFGDQSTIQPLGLYERPCGPNTPNGLITEEVIGYENQLLSSMGFTGDIVSWPPNQERKKVWAEQTFMYAPWSEGRKRFFLYEWLFASEGYTDTEGRLWQEFGDRPIDFSNGENRMRFADAVMKAWDAYQAHRSMVSFKGRFPLWLWAVPQYEGDLAGLMESIKEDIPVRFICGTRPQDDAFSRACDGFLRYGAFDLSRPTDTWQLQMMRYLFDSDADRQLLNRINPEARIYPMLQMGFNHASGYHAESPSYDDLEWYLTEVVKRMGFREIPERTHTFSRNLVVVSWDEINEGHAVVPSVQHPEWLEWIQEIIEKVKHYEG